MPEFTSTYICDPTKEYWGFKSWDDFFTRQFRPGLRPIASPENNTVITSACESVPYKLSTNAQLTSRFWLKAEHYSLFHMFNGDPFTPQFVGGTVYQAYLSTLYYHRWHSPVCGRVVKIVHVPGAYCAVSPSTGFHTLNGPDPGAPGNSQAFLTNIATRMLIFIHAESKDIGLMCFIAVGMVEVSSCEATVSAGEWVAKGQELGMFHYGGSTYCLVFREETARRLAFSEEIKRGLEDGKAKVLLNASIAYVTK
jgi:phosphatidylserine decarboxylase